MQQEDNVGDATIEAIMGGPGEVKTDVVSSKRPSGQCGMMYKLRQHQFLIQKYEPCLN